jgi:hypothetical protein
MHKFFNVKHLISIKLLLKIFISFIIQKAIIASSSSFFSFVVTFLNEIILFRV